MMPSCVAVSQLFTADGPGNPGKIIKDGDGRVKLFILEDYETLSERAAQIVSEHVQTKPNLVLGLATGSTPLGMYRVLVNWSKQGRVNFNKATTFNLDEYYPMAKEDYRSYYRYMLKNFWEPVSIPLERVNIPDGEAEDIASACRDYESKIAAAGGIDLIVLGIGKNGHIGFNEPGDSLCVNTHLVKLTELTIATNRKLLSPPGDIPGRAITMGMGTILKAREILLLAAGKEKADIVKESFNGIIRTKVPASLLQVHPRVTILLDRKAGEGLNRCGK